MISPIALANTLLMKSFEEKIPLSPMKLQKMIYFIYRDYLQEYGASLFREPFGAWDFGPVVESVYQTFKGYGGEKIEKFARDAKGNVVIAGDSDLTKIIDNVWLRYRHYSGVALSKMTHWEDSAWDKAIKAARPTLDDHDIGTEERGY
jgi:uncharacterized phage-associated protein